MKKQLWTSICSICVIILFINLIARNRILYITFLKSIFFVIWYFYLGVPKCGYLTLSSRYLRIIETRKSRMRVTCVLQLEIRELKSVYPPQFFRDRRTKRWIREITMLTRWHDDAAAREGKGRSAAVRTAASCQSSFVIRTGLRQWTTSVAENVISRCPRILSASPWPARCHCRRSEITNVKREETLPIFDLVPHSLWVVSRTH